MYNRHDDVLLAGMASNGCGLSAAIGWRSGGTSRNNVPITCETQGKESGLGA